MTSTELKSHPLNPLGVLVPCAVCSKEIHVSRAEAERKDFGPITCSYACMMIRKTRV